MKDYSKDFIYDEFQYSVKNTLTRHKSIIDVLSKLQETDARINRAVSKAVTTCGCISIDAKKQDIPENITFEELPLYTSTHINGKLCDDCREIIEKEIGNHLYYTAALCSLLNISLFDIILNEDNKLNTLGSFIFN